jgi:hypothetical protein
MSKKFLLAHFSQLSYVISFLRIGPSSAVYPNMLVVFLCFGSLFFCQVVNIANTSWSIRQNTEKDEKPSSAYLDQ